MQVNSHRRTVQASFRRTGFAAAGPPAGSGEVRVADFFGDSPYSDWARPKGGM